MSAAEAKNGKRRGEEEVPPTASFGVEGRVPGGQIGQFRIESVLGRGHPRFKKLLEVGK